MKGRTDSGVWVPTDLGWETAGYDPLTRLPIVDLPLTDVHPYGHCLCEVCIDFFPPSATDKRHYREDASPTADYAGILLDAYCCAGGATKGYQNAGFYVVGVDIDPQPHYCGNEFIQADALEILADAAFLARFDVIHASPPCQGYSDLRHRTKRLYPKLIEPTRDRLQTWGGPWVIENVEGAPLVDPIILCGTMFPGLRVIRHRQFESSVSLVAPEHPKHPLVFTHDKRKAHYGKLDQDKSFVQVTGGGNATIANKRAAMGCDWMTNDEVNEAIPPAYTEYLSAQMLAHLSSRWAA